MSYSAAVLADSPLLYWRLGETSGAAADSSGNSRSGTYNASGNTRGVAGLLDGDSNLALSETDQGGVTHASPTWANPLNALSLEAWVTPSSTALGHIAGRTSWAFAPSYTDRGWHLAIEGGRYEFGLTFTDGTYTVGLDQGNTVTSGVTKHVVGTWDGTTVRLYLDGAQVWSSGAFAGKTLQQPVTEAFRVGAVLGGAYGMQGVVDEVAVYSGALSSGQVAAHFLAGSTSTPSGSASGSLDLVASATGRHTGLGSASGVLDLTAAATDGIVRGSASGVLDVVGSASGDALFVPFEPSLFAGGIALESSNTVTYPTPPADPQAVPIGRTAVSVPEE